MKKIFFLNNLTDPKLLNRSVYIPYGYQKKKKLRTQ